MPELLLIRHGQASFGADDYDQLSELGWQQAKALGLHLKNIGWVPDRAITGSLKRQKQTLQGMEFECNGEVHPGWNEYDFHDLLHQRFGGRAPDKVITDRKTHFRSLRETLTEWQGGGVEGARETWETFTNRVLDARLHATERPVDRVLVVSSGGVIARLVSHTLQVPNTQMIALNLQIKNASLTRFIFSGGKVFLHEFNSLPFVSDAESASLISYS